MIHGSKLAAEDFPFRIHRRLMVWFLVSLAAHSLSAGFIVRGENLEVYATQPLTLLYVSFAVLSMWGSLCFGRKHHGRLSAWVLLLQIPAVLLMVNVLMLASGNYRPLMNTADLLVYHKDAPVVFVGRVLFMSLLVVFWLMAIGMTASKAAPSLALHRQEAGVIGYWAIALMLAAVPFCLNFYPPPLR